MKLQKICKQSSANFDRSASFIEAHIEPSTFWQKNIYINFLTARILVSRTFISGGGGEVGTDSTVQREILRVLVFMDQLSSAKIKTSKF